VLKYTWKGNKITTNQEYNPRHLLLFESKKFTVGAQVIWFSLSGRCADSHIFLGGLKEHSLQGDF